MFANTPDEAFHICSKYAPDCLGGEGYGSTHVVSSVQSVYSTSGLNGSSSSYHQSQSIGSTRDQANRFIGSATSSSADNYEGHREFVDMTGDVDGLEIVGEDDEYYNNLELEGEEKQAEHHQYSTSTQRSNDERHRTELNRSSSGAYDQIGRRPILPLPDPEFDSSASNKNRPKGEQPAVESNHKPVIHPSQVTTTVALTSI